MSFEGYYQRLCKKGHYDIVDVYVDDSQEGVWICSVCGEKEAWRNLVDCTNGDDWPIKMKMTMQKKCDHCDSVLETRFEIPENGRRP